jgi:hypothetical protein
MGCGCKKNNQEPTVRTANVQVVESQPAPPDNIQLTEEQQKLVNTIVEKINQVNNS